MIIGSTSTREDSVGGKRPPPDSFSRIAILAAAIAYAGLVLAAIHHHEPWADEAQAWLLARDASLWSIWTHLLHYEGSPGLWHTLLHILIGLGLPYSAFNYVPAIFGCAGAWLVMRYSPFPLAIRLLLPFTFFLGYQYVVIARSYDLLPVLLFAAAMLYGRAERRPAVFAALLCLMAMLSAHGLILSGCVVFSFAVFRWRSIGDFERRRLIWAGAVYVFVAALCCVAAMPASDVTFVTHPKFSISNWYDFSVYTLTQAFTGEGLSTLAVLALSIPLLWRGRGLLFFGLAAAILCTFGAVVYGAVWHQGMLLLAWIFGLWISARHIAGSSSGRQRKTAWASIAAVIAVHLYWTGASVAYDWNHAYSAGKEAAGFLKANGFAKGGIYPVGYATTSIQPYFAENILGQGAAYWDWSNRNHVNDAASLLASRGRGHVIVGYKLQADRDHWAGLMRVTGYDPVRHFEGNLFWHTQKYEAESFDLYEWNPREENLPKFSMIQMNDQAASVQLIEGVHGLEANAWRWTARNFSFVVKAPEGAASKGGILRLQLFVSESQIGSLGPITLRADIQGTVLPERTYAQAGSYEYSAAVPGKLLAENPVCVTVRLDKAKPPSALDQRELGVIITSAGLAPNIP
jgi:hypothetical protein